MKKTNTEGVTTSRDRIRERLMKEYPDTDFNAENASDVENDSIVSLLEKYDAELEGYRSNNDRVSKLFDSDPRAGRFFVNWMASGGNPIQYLLDIFGPELTEAMESEEGRAKIVESTNKYLERKAENEKGEAERMANYEQSINDLTAFAQEKGLSEEQAVSVFEKVNQIAFDAVDGKYTREAYEMEYNAMNYDGDVEKARTEGEVTGRNAKIEERLGKVNKKPEMPPSLGGQGGAVAEPAPRRGSDPVLDAMREKMAKGPGTRGTFGK